MNAARSKTWLLAYDIRDPKRLLRLHRHISKIALPVQYSVFSLEATDAAMRDHLADISELINPRVDDVRAWHIPAHCKVWVYGHQATLDGVHLAGTDVTRFLTRAERKPAADEDQPR